MLRLKQNRAAAGFSAAVADAASGAEIRPSAAKRKS
jgi:hypothetical protein